MHVGFFFKKYDVLLFSPSFKFIFFDELQVSKRAKTKKEREREGYEKYLKVEVGVECLVKAERHVVAWDVKGYLYLSLYCKKLLVSGIIFSIS